MAYTLVKFNRTRFFLTRFLLAAALLFVILQTSFYVSETSNFEERRASILAALERAETIIQSELSAFATDLHILSHDDRLLDFALGNEDMYQPTLRGFMSFTEHKSSITQLRIISGEGKEIIRVNRKNGLAHEVPQEKLQKKSGRYYFTEALKLKTGQIYFSPIDLNVENGKIERPWRPVLRLATPLRAEGNGKRSVLIMNINAERWLNNVIHTQADTASPIQLANRDGYWLLGAPETELWGFMFGRETRLGTENPRLWSWITQHGDGEFDQDGVHYVFRTILRGSFAPYLTEHISPSSGNVALVAFSELPSPTIPGSWNVASALLTAVLMAALAVICFGWARAAEARHLAMQGKEAAQAEMIRRERLASLGSLVAGIAHELNTPIGSAVLVGSTLSSRFQEFLEMIKSGKILRSDLEVFERDLGFGMTILLRNLERAADLIGHFKQMAMDQTSERRRKFELSDCVQDVLASISPQIRGKKIVIVRKIDPGLTLVSFPGALAQVLINLITNAQMHAFGDDQSGQITITGKAAGSDEIELVVADNGHGIPEDLRQQVFERFFTTKLASGGNGLGLSIVRNIVESVLGGTVSASNAQGGGATLTIRFPRVSPDGATDYAQEKVDAQPQQAA
ncbi:Signal transduction histidine kinase-like protein [Stappia aggregata IAM 12614]|uniref:histidine kinase n=1 Tax=Roseibium aggregatum (strain ATCC 25650 / DSM 13394 / JCM 20685 / NBRC 16684 / NCIMB 2208 / IAM 12614 / B1) TaxID=384765 RepID=A0P380_ROSAI|nr:sensor histidine kinase [Roseibium aggregatum]EAV40551.1 Signal transduction histidine kinase-like protein [Stappia aggregata IAM 12614] [Roseibium aggregatum IAM 12614]